VGDYTRKGSLVLVQGHLHTDRWAAPDGAQRQRLVVIGESWLFADPLLVEARKLMSSAVTELIEHHDGLHEDDVLVLAEGRGGPRKASLMRIVVFVKTSWLCARSRIPKRGHIWIASWFMPRVSFDVLRGLH
jgi:Single-strand binding protein family